MNPVVPHFSLNQVSTLGWPFERDLDAYAAADVPAIGVSLHKLEAFGTTRGVRLVRERGLPVSCLTTTGPITLDDTAGAAHALGRAREHLGVAAELGAACLMLLGAKKASRRRLGSRQDGGQRSEYSEVFTQEGCSNH